jgi:transposase
MNTLEPKTDFRLNATLKLPDAATSRTAEPRKLAQAVQAAVRAIDESTLRPVSRRDAGLAFQPKALLALLTYCYALEIYGSGQVENLLSRDLNYRQLCQDQFPDARVIRRFRRENREAIRLCLTDTLRFQVEQKLQDGFVTRVNVAQLADEAKRRLTMAMFIDTMERDGE